MSPERNGDRFRGHLIIVALTCGNVDHLAFRGRGDGDAYYIPPTTHTCVIRSVTYDLLRRDVCAYARRVMMSGDVLRSTRPCLGISP